MFGSCFIEAASSRPRKVCEDVLRPLHGLLTSRPTGGDGEVIQKLGSHFIVSPQLMLPLQSIYGPTGLLKLLFERGPRFSKLHAAVTIPYFDDLEKGSLP